MNHALKRLEQIDFKDLNKVAIFETLPLLAVLKVLYLLAVFETL